MSSLIALAEACRKAIFCYGGDDLAKLTAPARGEDAPVYSESVSVHPFRPLNALAANAAFVREVPLPLPPPKDTETIAIARSFRLV